MKRTGLLLAAVFALVVPLAAQNPPNANGLMNNTPDVVDRLTHVIDPDAVVYGRTYSEWSAEWQQWATSIPVDNHPLFDNDAPRDCGVGQSGPVWFLGGRFCPNGVPCDLTGIKRSCTIPSTKAIYFPILNYEDSALEEDIAENPGNMDARQIGFMRALTYNGMEPATVSAWVDGIPIRNLKRRFRTESVPFAFTLPQNNIYTAIYGTNFPSGSHFPALDDGYYVMLEPLPPGQHFVHFAGGNGTFALDVTYHLTITK